MASGIDACEVEADQLLNDLFSGDPSDFVGLSFGFSLFDHLVCLSLLLDIVLNEILFGIFLQSQAGLQNLVDFFPDLAELCLHVPILLAEVHVLDLFPEEEREKDVGSRSGPVEDIDCELC